MMACLPVVPLTCVPCTAAAPADVSPKVISLTICASASTVPHVRQTICSSDVLSMSCMSAGQVGHVCPKRAPPEVPEVPEWDGPPLPLPPPRLPAEAAEEEPRRLRRPLE